MRKPRSKRDKALAEQDWEACKCSKYLLGLENVALDLNHKVTDYFKDSPSTILRSHPATSVLTIFIEAFKNDDPLLREMVGIAFDAPLPELTYQTDRDDIIGGPLAGEVAARTFIKCCYLAFSDLMESKAGPWFFIEHGVSIATTWEYWRSWAQRFIDGGSIEHGLRVGMKNIAAASEGGDARAANGSPRSERDAQIRAYANSLTQTPTIRGKAKKAKGHFPQFNLTEESYRKIISG